MIKFKNRSEVSLSALMICMVSECKEEAHKLWSTETNIVDVCQKHYNQLLSEEE